MKTWLFFDVSNLVWRAYHTKKHLSFDGDKTGVIFGVLQDIKTLTLEFGTWRVAFFFDGNPQVRKDILPSYKQKRHANKILTPEETAEYRSVIAQKNRLATSVLPEMGFKNLFHDPDREADDIIASTVIRSILPYEDREAIIVSSDKDLYQLLGPRVSVWAPAAKEMMTRKKFKAKYGIKPNQWALAKAIAGCITDEIKGIEGVGEVRACQFIRKELKGNYFDAVVDAFTRIQENLRVTTLPFPGTKSFSLKKDEMLLDATWNRIAKSLGMESLVGRAPARRK